MTTQTTSLVNWSEELEKMLKFEQNYKSPAAGGPLDEKYHETMAPEASYHGLIQKYHGLYTETELHKLYLIWTHLFAPLPPPDDIIEACKKTVGMVHEARKVIPPIRQVKPEQMTKIKQEEDEIQLIVSPVVMSLQACLLADFFILWENLIAGKAESERMGCPLCTRIIGCKCSSHLQAALLINDNRFWSGHLFVQEGLFTHDSSSFKILWPSLAIKYPIIAVKIRHPSSKASGEETWYAEQWYYARNNFVNHPSQQALQNLATSIREIHKSFSKIVKRSHPLSKKGPNYAAKLMLMAASSGIETPVMTKPMFSLEEVEIAHTIGSPFKLPSK